MNRIAYNCSSYNVSLFIVIVLIMPYCRWGGNKSPLPYNTILYNTLELLQYSGCLKFFTYYRQVGFCSNSRICL